MEIIIYSQKNHPQKDILKKKIQDATDIKPAIAFDSESIFDLVKSKMYGQIIMVFLISSYRELKSLSSNKKKLFDSRHILILPNNEENLMSMGFSLYPRYLACITPDFKDISEVLKKMVQYNAAEEARLQKLLTKKTVKKK